VTLLFRQVGSLLGDLGGRSPARCRCHPTDQRRARPMTADAAAETFRWGGSDLSQGLVAPLEAGRAGRRPIAILDSSGNGPRRSRDERRRYRRPHHRADLANPSSRAFDGTSQYILVRNNTKT